MRQRKYERRRWRSNRERIRREERGGDTGRDSEERQGGCVAGK